MRMNPKIQNAIVIALFLGVIAFIAYPVITKSSLLAIPADQMHLSVDKTGSEPAPESQEAEISAPIFKEK